MYKQCSIDASLVVRWCITFMGVKNKENCGGNLLLQPDASRWRFQIC